MKWRGIRRGSIDVSKALDESLLCVNSRFKVGGEMRRRRGMARTNIIKKDNGITNLSGFSAFQSNVMAALVDGSNLQGYQQPAALWGDNPNMTSTSRTYVPVFEFSYSGGYLCDPYIDVTDFVPVRTETPLGGANPSWFTGGYGATGKYRHVFIANTAQNFVISADFTEQRTFGAGTPADSGGGMIVGLYETATSTYIPQTFPISAYPALYPSQLWWDALDTPIYRCIYNPTTYAWTITSIHP